jgi:hypothetical protein
MEPRSVAIPVCEFVKRRAVIARRVVEGFFRRQVNVVCGRGIEPRARAVVYGTGFVYALESSVAVLP